MSKVTQLHPKIPNISGTAESCMGCRFSIEKARHNNIVALLAKEALRKGNPAPQPTPSDELVCAFNPGGGVIMKSWGWCGQFEAKGNGK